MRDDSGVHLGGPAEIERRQLIAESSTITILRNEVKQLKGQLQAAYVRINELTSEVNKLKNKG